MWSSPRSPAGSAPAAFEVAEDHARLAVGGAEIRQQLLHHPFAAAVGVDRQLWSALVDRDRLGRLPSGLEQGERIAQVVAVVLRRVADACAHIGVGREMQHRDHRISSCGGSSPHHQGHAHNCLHVWPVALHNVVEHHYELACLLEGPNCVAADLASAAGDENGHDC